MDENDEAREREQDVSLSAQMLPIAPNLHRPGQAFIGEASLPEELIRRAREIVIGYELTYDEFIEDCIRRNVERIERMEKGDAEHGREADN